MVGLTRIVIAALLTTTLVVLPRSSSQVEAIEPSLLEGFEGVAVGSDPVGWVDTAANNSMAVNDSLFEVMAVDGSQALGTASTTTNIHSHHVGGPWTSSGGYTLSGRLRMSDQSAGIGVTVLSDYNESDSYYRLRRFNSNGSFGLSPHGTSMTGGVTDSGVVPAADVWYEFKIEALDTGSRTEIRAKVWEQGTTEPVGWQIDAYDDSATRLTAGTVGVWSHSRGSKFWDDLTVEALAVPGPHALAVSSSGSGTVSVDPALAEYEHGTSVTLTATPDTGWEFIGWSGDLVGSDNPATVTIESDTTIEAMFVEQIEVTLTTSTEGSGSVTVNPEQATYLAGDSVTLTATPDTGWRFTGWTGGLTGTTNPTTTTLTDNTTITATFQQLPDADLLEGFEGVAVGSDPVGWVDTAANNSMAVNDSLFEVMAVDGSQALGTASTTTNIHSHHVGGPWTSSGGYTLSGRLRMSDQSAGIGVTVLSDYNESDSYYRLRRFNSNGSFGLSPHGTSMTGGVTDSGVVPAADVWYEFKIEALDTGSRTEIRAKVWEQGTTEPVGWQIDAYDDSATRLTAGTVGVWSHSRGSKFWDDLTVEALAVPGPHALAVSSSGSGTVSVDPALAEYEHGTSVTLTATPDTGWEFIGWSGDLVGSDNPATVTIESDTTIEAMFVEQIEVTLTTSTEGSGSVTVNPEQATYLAGDSVTLTATPDTGWRFTGWTGGLTGTTNPTTTTLTDNTTITATFQQLPDGAFTLTTDVAGSGAVAANPGQTTFAVGELVTLTATPDPGWQLGSWEMSPPLLDDWWDTQWNYRTSVDVGADGMARTDALARVDVDFTATLSSLGVSGTFDTSSLRVVEVDDSGAPIDASAAFQFDPTADFDATTNASGTLWILLSGQTASGQIRSFDVYFDTVGKGFAAASVIPRIDVADGVVREGLNTVRISTGSGTFFYDKDGGGFSSLLDADGNDWISWNSATGAAGEFRGVPNLVFPGALMHPGLGGVQTTIVDSGPLVTTLRSTSLDGQWTTEWRIGPERADLTVVEAANDYWFLYEGTPGGSLETNSDTVTRSDGTVTTAGTAWTGDLPGDEWVAFGDPGVGRSLYVANHEPDQSVDSYRSMDGAMTVFGFGRQNTNTYLSGVDRSFSIGLTEGTGATQVGARAMDAIQPPTAVVTGARSTFGTIAATNPLSFPMFADHTVTAVFEPVPSATLDISVVGDGVVQVEPDQATYSEGQQVTLTAAAGADSAFERWSGGATGSENPLTITLSGSTTVTATFGSASSQPQIDVWYGDDQVYGAIGIPQPYYNLLGNVSDPDGVASLSYSVNGAAPRALSIGPDRRRLAEPGDFNVDLAFSDLQAGLNDVVLTATDADGNTAVRAVRVQRDDGNVWPSTYSIDWDAIGAINDVAQVVDGKWALDAGGVRAVEPDYDRVISLGDVNWTDYEVTVPVTFNALDTNSFTSSTSGGPGLGLLMRWNGHTDNPVANWQPKAGWLPHGAIAWYRWKSATDVSLRLEGNNRKLDSDGVAPPVIGSTIVFKLRVETQPDGTHYYRLKTWPSGNAEPTAWTLSGYGASTDPDSGSLLLLAHHVDATFGDVTIAPLGASEGTLDVQTVGAGTVTVDPVQGLYAFGETVTLTATPDVGQVFAGWGGDISGLENPVQLLMDSSKTVTAAFVDASVDPVVGGVSVERFVDSAVVSWSTDKPTTGSVLWGTSSAYGSGPVLSSTTATSHSVTLSGLDPATVYHYQITATDTSGNTVVTPDATFTTLAVTSSALASDDFNACSVDGSVWTFVDPVGDSSVSVNGTQLELSVPAGIAHDVWSGGNMAPRLMQPVGDGDFEVEVKFESPVTDSFEMQGLIVQQDLDDFLRFDFFGSGGQTRVFAARFVGGSPTALANVAIPVSAAPLYIKVTRTGDTWALAYSSDGSTWTTVTSFVHALTVSEVGPFVGNAGSSPPGHTALIDYVFDTSSPIVPEDPETPACVDASVDPVVGGVSVERFVDSAVVSWSTDKPTTGSVLWGTSSAYGSGPVLSSTTATSHSVTLSGLDPATVYHYQITATDTSGNTVVTPDATFTTLAVTSSALASDDFNACSVDGSVWTFVDPVGDSSVSVNGTQLELSVPAGIAHDVWSGGNMAPRLMQPVGDGDFEVEVKFESPVTDSFEMQGLIVQQDLDDFLRFDFFGSGGQTRVFAARFVGGSPTALANVAIPVSAAPLYIKVTRTGDTWALAYSSDGSTWTTVTSFVHALTVSEVGPFVGNAGSSPPGHTALIDYVFDTSSPIVPEDPETPAC